MNAISNAAAASGGVLPSPATGSDTASIPQAPARAPKLHRRHVAFEGPIASAVTLAAYAYLPFARSIGAGMGWVLFLCGLGAFFLSIFASTRHSRWWFLVTLLAFAFLITFTHVTEGCANPCQL